MSIPNAARFAAEHEAREAANVAQIMEERRANIAALKAKLADAARRGFTVNATTVAAIARLEALPPAQPRSKDWPPKK